MSGEESWKQLLLLLKEEPDPIAFRAICALLENWPDEEVAPAIDYTLDALESWPDDCCAAPWSWCEAQAEGARQAAWPLVRAIDFSGSSEFDPASLPSYHGIGQLRLSPYSSYYGISSIRFLMNRPLEELNELREVSGVILSNLDEVKAFLAWKPLTQLESLGLQARSHIVSSHQWHEPLLRLRSLSLEARYFTQDFSGLLDPTKVPLLENLALRGKWQTGEAPEALLRLTDSAVCSQIRSLYLEEIPEEWLLALCDRHKPSLESLVLANRPYIPHLVDHQQHACRLGINGIRALTDSGSLSHLQALRVSHERVGDAIVDLVGAVEPGVLKQLALIDVDLTDEGLEQIAQLPQMATVTDLDLSANQFTDSGLSQLLNSPQLSQLQHLTLGGLSYNPHYSNPEPHQLGNGGLEALLRSNAFPRLRSLTFRNARIDQNGMEVLSHLSRVPQLEALNLSFNRLEARGVMPLAQSGLLDGVRQLSLSCCHLDDSAVGRLLHADLSSLQELELSYNLVAAEGARKLAGASALEGLWHLGLHDNHVQNEGLIALAQSRALKNLVSLTLKQEVCNAHLFQIDEEAVDAILASPLMARLDRLRIGIVDEYQGSHHSPFAWEDLKNRLWNSKLRFGLGQGFAALEEMEEEDIDEEADDPEDRFSHDFRYAP